MHIAVINGPNLNRLGKRRPERYGYLTLNDLVNELTSEAEQLGVRISHFQSNHEGEIVDWVHSVTDDIDAFIINPAGLTPYGRSLQDAVADTELPIGVVHITQHYLHYGENTPDLFRGKASVYVCGLGTDGYSAVMKRLHSLHRRESVAVQAQSSASMTSAAGLE